MIFNEILDGAFILFLLWLFTAAMWIIGGKYGHLADQPDYPVRKVRMPISRKHYDR